MNMSVPIGKYMDGCFQLEKLPSFLRICLKSDRFLCLIYLAFQQEQQRGESKRISSFSVA